MELLLLTAIFYLFVGLLLNYFITISGNEHKVPGWLRFMTLFFWPVLLFHYIVYGKKG